MRWTPERRTRWLRVAFVIGGVLFLIYALESAAFEIARDGVGQSMIFWYVCFPILLIGVPQTARLARRVMGVFLEWPAWRHRNDDPASRVFRGHPDGRYETLHEQRARRFEAAQARATKMWRHQVGIAADEIYGDEGPPEKPETPEWLKTDARR